MTPLEDAVGSVLERYMPSSLARSIRVRAQSATGVPEGNLRVEHLPALLRHVEDGVRLFVEPALRNSLLRELTALGGPRPASVAPVSMIIETEAHVALARRQTRELALALGAGVLPAQRAATVVSELARNIVAYADTGRLDVGPHGKRELVVRAVDRGPGIPELETVLAGEPPGQGLRAVRRLARRVDIDTGPDGTWIEVVLGL